ncbi:MAG: non-heme iron oxygenase ferredoxin subunit [Polaromonas sp.]|jgi:naphthalene 1,2-dioxygenase system ferredoxin subunit|uniref:non-heme iron oxygenase ferredoxin subunit n=1 Tax=Polaromonas sp. TaxID=1869339 RepID=UPI00260117C9|nr:non-heme iron oxygenase ferredoxin subunit [Polaromonas sp.]MBI2726255.1 non-heme iron oxygenase ferredoxin subunit [Polaromonas sp.]
MSEKWIDVGAKDDMWEGAVTGVYAAGKEIAIYHVEGNLYATSGVCTHGNAKLCDGYLEGHEIECPLHQGRFDVRTGKAMCAPLTEDIRVFALRCENGRVEISLS